MNNCTGDMIAELGKGGSESERGQVGASRTYFEPHQRAHPVVGLDEFMGLQTFCNVTGPELLQCVFNSGDSSFALVNEIIANLSESLTRFVCTQPMDSDYYLGPAAGVAYVSGICLEVHWGRIVFLAAVATARGYQPVWKESFLAWVLRGPHRQPPPPQPHLLWPSMKRMERAARDVYVTLVGEGGVAGPHIGQAEASGEQRPGRGERVATMLPRRQVLSLYTAAKRSGGKSSPG